MIAPYMQNGLELTLTGKIVSTPYIEMTLEMMSPFRYRDTPLQQYHTSSAGRYCPKQFQIEPDWSAASYWYEIAACTQFEIFPPESLNKAQGDARIAALFEPLGVSSLFSGRHKTKKIGQNHFIIRTGPIRATRLSPNPCRNLLFNRLPFKFTGLQTLK